METKLTTSTEWIDPNKDLPKLNDEYLVVWDLNDNQHPVVASMDFDVKRKCFTDPRNEDSQIDMIDILFWAELPPTPNIDKSKYMIAEPPKSIDEMERLAYGQCRHGENMARCMECNPNG